MTSTNNQAQTEFVHLTRTQAVVYISGEFTCHLELQMCDRLQNECWTPTRIERGLNSSFYRSKCTTFLGFKLETNFVVQLTFTDGQVADFLEEMGGHLEGYLAQLDAVSRSKLYNSKLEKNIRLRTLAKEKPFSRTVEAFG